MRDYEISASLKLISYVKRRVSKLLDYKSSRIWITREFITQDIYIYIHLSYY